MNATLGLERGAKAAFSGGRAALTSGHHGRPVVGSLDAIKARNNSDVASPGMCNAAAHVGSSKSLRIVIVLGKYGREILWNAGAATEEKMLLCCG